MSKIMKKKEKDPNVDSGDEYDSGEEVQRTAADDDFIDRNDDQADILAEYDAEEQNFHDDRPDRYKKAKKSSSSSSSSRGEGGHGPKSDDALSKTLEHIKKKKVLSLSLSLSLFILILILLFLY